MEFSSLASSSSGNSYFFKANGYGLLIDAGISAKQICERLSIIGRNIRNIRAILITHEHADHIQGLKVLLRYGLPVYLTSGTLNSCGIKIPQNLVNIIKAGDHFTIDDIDVDVIGKSHDAAEPVSYSLTYENKTVSFITDIGYADADVKKAVHNSDALFIEANHDISMLKNGRYPYPLKARILGERGHLSNYDASLLVLEYAKPGLKNLFLSHLSASNNSPDMALATFKTILSEREDLQPRIDLSFPDRPTELFRL